MSAKLRRPAPRGARQGRTQATHFPRAVPDGHQFHRRQNPATALGNRPNPPPHRAPNSPRPQTGEVITIKPPIVVRELAAQLKQKPFKIIADLMELGVFANVNQAIDEKIAAAALREIRFPF